MDRFRVAEPRRDDVQRHAGQQRGGDLVGERNDRCRRPNNDPEVRNVGHGGSLGLRRCPSVSFLSSA
jgi:hypothetical protein